MENFIFVQCEKLLRKISLNKISQEVVIIIVLLTLWQKTCIKHCLKYIFGKSIFVFSFGFQVFSLLWRNFSALVAQDKYIYRFCHSFSKFLLSMNHKSSEKFRKVFFWPNFLKAERIKITLSNYLHNLWLTCLTRNRINCDVETCYKSSSPAMFWISFCGKICNNVKKTSAMDPTWQKIELKTSMHLDLHLTCAFIWFQSARLEYLFWNTFWIGL